MSTTYYLKYSLKYSLIYEILNKLHKKRINFFIDLQSIARGFYNKEVISIEISRYALQNKPSDILIEEMRFFLNDLYKRFKKYDPFFILFYDDGFCEQQKIVDSNYKSGRSIKDILLQNDLELQLFFQIKKYYYHKIKQLFTKKDLSEVYYLKEYESDFIPHYCITNGLYDSSDNDILNVILSVDKDLLQTCKFVNTIQCVTSFNKPNKNEKFNMIFEVFDKNNAISYINKNFKVGILTAEYIPMILSLSGDKSDNIKGIQGIGVSKACNLIITYKIPPDIKDLDLKNSPKILTDNIDLITRNFKLISFDEQIKRIPMHKIKGGDK